MKVEDNDLIMHGYEPVSYTHLDVYKRQILTISILNGLSEIVGLKDINRRVEEGYTSFEIPEIKDPVQKIQADALMDTFHLGLCATEAAYRDYVKIIDN